MGEKYLVINKDELTRSVDKIVVSFSSTSLRVANAASPSPFERCKQVCQDSESMGWYKGSLDSNNAIPLLKAMIPSSHSKLTFDAGHLAKFQKDYIPQGEEYSVVGLKKPLYATAGEVTTASTKLLLLEDVTTARGRFNAASDEVRTAELVKDIDQDFAHMVAASKVLMLKPGEFELWRMRIEQYIQMIDYALWEVIENGATLPKTQVVEGIPNEHQLKFNSIKDAKLLLEAIEKRFGGNETTKKTQRNLLNQQYENFTTPSSEMLDQTLIGFKILNKADLDTMSIDDLYNNLKVYEPEVKRISSSSLSTQNMDFVSSSNNNTSSSNEAVNAAHGVTTASTQVNTLL
ncbi:hypothetical protein Tco_1303276 [Tanacetum coccineum]